MARQLSEAKRTQFLNSALKLFAEHGVQGTSTTKIAKNAGTAAGTLFLYFPTKQDLVNDLVLKISQEQAEAINHQLDPTLSVQDTFSRIWTGSVEWFLQNLDAFHYVLKVRDSNLIPQEIAQRSESYFGYYFTAIQRGLDEDEIKPYPLELVGSMLYQNIVAVVNLIGRQPESEKQSEYIQAGFKIFWDGIRRE